MKISFIKLSPAENTTIIITEADIRKEDYIKIAKTAMAYTHLNGEQVGFITPKTDSRAKGRMEMSGGEFCGNGLLALGAYIAWQEDLEKETFLLEFSGVGKTLECEVRKVDSVTFRVKGEMPLEGYGISKKEVVTGKNTFAGYLVAMQGITHFIFQESERENNPTDYRELLKHLAREESSPAFGALGYRISGEDIHLSPWVYVPGIESFGKERSCGSGSLALGLLWAMKKEEDIRLNIQQPGGVIAVRTAYDRRTKKVTSATIETEVQITCEGNLLL